MAIGLKLRNLLFLIHTVSPERAQPHLPAGLELDVYPTPAGPRAFLATVVLEAGPAFPYVMTGFRQINYRLYVRHGEQAGILYLRSWVSSRAAAAAMSLAIPTEHASVRLQIEDHPVPYSQYRVEGRSGEHVLKAEAAAADQFDCGPFAHAEEAIHFLTHRLAGFASGAHPKGGLSIVRVTHPPMQPMPARVQWLRSDQWVESGLLSPEEVQRPLLALIQPEIEFDMNLPEKLDS